MNLISLDSERTSFGQTGLTTSWLAQNSGAGTTQNNSLSMGEDSGDLVTSWALNVHEEGVWCWDQTLQLVCLSLGLSIWIQ